MNKNENLNNFFKINSLRHYLITIMRVFLLLITIGLSSAFANPANAQKKLNVNVKNISLEDLFSKIQNRSEYVFFYRDDVLYSNEKISIKVKKTALPVILEKAFEKTNLSFKISGRQVVVLKSSIFKTENSEILTVIQEKTISGTIVDSLGIPLPGANIIVKGTSNGTISDIDGKFTLVVSDDDKVLVVSYVGFTTQEIEINNQTTFNIVLAEDATSLGQVLIIGQRLSNLKAITSKREKFVVIDAISTDEVGSLPDDNIGDAIRRVPGVSQKGDQGETRFISVRGLNPDYNFTTFNGSLIAVPDRGGRRAFLDVMPSSLAKELQVIKTFSADLDAGGIGAHINFVPRSALDFNQDQFLKVFFRGGGYQNNEGPEGVGPAFKGDFVFGVKMGKNKKIGLLIAGDYYKRDSYTDHLQNDRINVNKIEPDGDGDYEELGYTFTSEGRKLEADDGTIYDFGDERTFVSPNGVGRFVYRNNRTRTGISAVLDIETSETSKITFLQFYNEGKDDEVRYGNRWTSDADASYTGGQQSGLFSIRKRLETADFQFTRQIWGTQLQFDKDYANSHLKLKLNYSGSEFFNNENFFRFTNNDRLTFNYDLNDRHVQMTPVDLAAYNDLSGNRMLGDFANFQELRNLQENIWESQADFDHNLNKTGFGYKTGLKFRSRFRKYNEDQITFGLLDEFRYTAEDFIADPYTQGDFNSVQPNDDLFIIDREQVLSELGTNGIRTDPSITTRQVRYGRSEERDSGVTEEVFATYAMLTHVGERHHLNAGLRYENTSFEGRGRKIIDGENGNEADEWEDATNSGDYSNLLPSLNFSYDFSEQFKGRFAYSRSLGRPDFDAFTPRGESLNLSNVDPTTEEISGSRGNPDLKPRESDNIDFSLEYYLNGGTGIISLGLFFKNIKNEFFRISEPKTVTLDDGRVLPAFITQFSNLDENVKINGIELNIVKDFDFLPKPFDGLGASFNATWLYDSKFKAPNTGGTDVDEDGINDLSPFTEVQGLVEQANEIYNASLYYENKKWKARIAWHYTGDFLNSINTSNPERNDVQLARSIMDLKLEYKINSHFRISFLGQNLTDSGRREDFSNYGLPNLANLVKRDFGKSWSFGMTYKL